MSEVEDHDTLLRISTVVDHIDQTMTDHEGRLRRIERIVWVAMGLAATAGGSIGSVITGMMNGIGN